MAAAVGIDIGGTKLLAVRIEDGRVVDQLKTSKPDDGAAMAGAVTEGYAAMDGGGEPLGVGVAGLVDFASGTFVWGPHVDGERIPLREILSEQLAVPVAVDNDANTTALAEHRMGAGRGSRVMLMVTLGTGIGGGLVVDGALYRGRAFAGEFGHARFGSGTHECDCGRVGCWETEAAGPALERWAGEVYGADGPGSGPEVTAAALAGDSKAVELIARVGDNLGIGLASLIATLDPDRIVIGGGLGSIGALLLEPARASVRRAQYASEYSAMPDIVGAELGERAGAVGAALLALEEAQ